MSKKNIFLLALGYIAGGVIASLYSKKDSKSIKRDLSKAKDDGEGKFGVFFENFLSIHTSLLEDVKKEIFCERNKEIFSRHKDELIKIIDSYKLEGEELIKELKGKGKTSISNTLIKLEELYNQKLNQLDDLKGLSSDGIKKVKDGLYKCFEDFKNSVKK